MTGASGRERTADDTEPDEPDGPEIVVSSDGIADWAPGGPLDYRPGRDPKDSDPKETDP